MLTQHIQTHRKQHKINKKPPKTNKQKRKEERNIKAEKTKGKMHYIHIVMGLCSGWTSAMQDMNF